MTAHTPVIFTFIVSLFLSLVFALRPPDVTEDNAKQVCKERGIYQGVGDKMCCLCLAGQFKANDCRFGLPNTTVCVSCPYDDSNSSNQTYMESSNNSTRCNPSISESVCEKLAMAFYVPGSRIKPSRCECLTGYEEDPPGTLLQRGCAKKITCVAGFQLNSNRSSEVLCVKCPAGTFSNESSSSCMPFKRCEPGTTIAQNGTSTSDVVCSKPDSESYSTTAEIAVTAVVKLTDHETNLTPLWIILGLLAAVVIAVFCYCYCRKSKKKKKTPDSQQTLRDPENGASRGPQEQNGKSAPLLHASATQGHAADNENGNLAVVLLKQNEESVQFARHASNRSEEHSGIISEAPSNANGNLQARRNLRSKRSSGTTAESEKDNLNEPNEETNLLSHTNIGDETADNIGDTRIAQTVIKPRKTSTEPSCDQEVKVESSLQIPASAPPQTLKAEIMQKARQSHPDVEVSAMEDRVSINLKDQEIGWNMLESLVDSTAIGDMKNIVRKLSLTEVQISDTEHNHPNEAKERKYQWALLAKKVHGRELTPVFLLSRDYGNKMPKDNMMKVFVEKLVVLDR